MASNKNSQEFPPMKYILVTGGVISGVGKGIISSSLGVLLKNSGYKVSAIKIDPYLNIDAGTFSPYEHGEVFVLDDGGEVDLDLGNYERFLNVKLTSDNNITTGKIYKTVIEKERRGDYMGKTVQTIPHVTDTIVQWVERVAQIPVDGTDCRPDVCIIELGGTVGDIEGMPFTYAFERFQSPAKRRDFMNVHVSLILHPKATGEPKTKPMQNSVKSLRAEGIVPDLLICRSTNPIENSLRKKISEFGLVELEQVVGVHDVSNIYKVPLLLQEQGVLELIKNHLQLKVIEPEVQKSLRFSMIHWTHLSELVDSYDTEVTIALVGKYIKFPDAYASLIKALSHAAIHSKRKMKIVYVDSEHLEEQHATKNPELYNKAWKDLISCQGVIVPGGFDYRGVEGMIRACQYARTSKTPFLGVCLGMQCAAIEFARNVLGIEGANSNEFVKEGLAPRQQVIIDMPEHDVEKKGLGGTMRLGKRTTMFLTENCRMAKLYGTNLVEERHRHRFEVNPAIVPELSENGLLFVGMGVDENNTPNIEDRRTQSSKDLMVMAEKPGEELLKKISELCLRGGDGVVKAAVRMEILELKGHPYFTGCQFHPEYLSSPLTPSPPFLGLVLAASAQLETYLSGEKAPTPMVTLESRTDRQYKLSSLLI